MNQLAVILDSDISSLLDGKIGHKNWKGVLYIPPEISASTKIGNGSILTIQLCYFLLAGISEIFIICNEVSYAQSVVNELEIDGRVLNTSSQYEQKLEQFAGNANVMIIYKPLFLYGVNLTQKFRWAMTKPGGTTVLVIFDPSGAKEDIFYDTDQHLVFDRKDEGVTKLIDYSYLPILFCKSDEYIKYANRWDEIPLSYIEPVRRGTVKCSFDNIDSVKDAEIFTEMMKRQMNIDIYNVKKILNIRFSVDK